MVAAWLKRAVEVRHARKGIKRGSGLSALLAAFSPAASRQAADEARRALAERTVPTSNAAALIHAFGGDSDPFGRKRAAVIGVGDGAKRELELLIAVTGRRTVVGAHVVEPEPTVVRTPLLQARSDDLWSRIEAAVQWGGALIEAGQADVIAVLLRPPISGNWSDEKQLDVARLMRTLLHDHPHPVWLTMAEPADPSIWPEHVDLMLPLSARAFLRALRNRGNQGAPLGRRIERRGVRLDGNDACQIAVALADAPEPTPVRRDSSTSAPHYGAEVTLALQAAKTHEAVHVELDSGASRDLQALLDATNTRFVARQTDGASLMLPLTIIPNRIVAWRTTRQGALTTMTSSSNVGAVPAIRWLSEACASRDESVVAAVLADHGRAWLESRDLAQALPLLDKVTQEFHRQSRAHLWAHYLVALDAALRLNDAGEHWFDDESCRAAENSELSLLYQVERMEFRRLRGDLEAACWDLDVLMPQLTQPIRSTTSSQIYADATARYVAANTLRRGGRYDLARELINQAVAAYNPDVPAHRIELTHGTYAIAVCDSLRGIATVRATDGDEGQAVFARSLVTLANSHASWFVEDYARAVDFANRAETGFESIGYQRYADRSRDLARLVADWAQRTGRAVAPGNQPDVRVDALLTALPGESIQQLAHERPSRALSLLYFATAFGHDPEAPRSVALPSYIATTDQGTLTLRTPPPATSFRHAEQTLRGILGVAADTRLPLAVD